MYITMKSFRTLAFVACFALSVAMAMPQGGLGKGRGQNQGGGQSQGQGGGNRNDQGRSQGGGNSSGNQGRGQSGGGSSGGSQSGGLGKGRGDQGRGQSGGGSGGSSGGGLGRSQGGGQSGGGGLGRGQGGGNTGGSGGLGSRGQGGGSSSGGLGSGNRGNTGGSGSGSQGSGGLGKGRGDQSRGQGGSGSTGGNSGGLGNQGSRGDRGNGSLGNGGLGNGGGNNGRDNGNVRDQGNGGLGRINDTRDRTNSLGKIDKGRLGQSNYGSNNNQGRGGNGINIDAPRLQLNKGSLPSQVFRSENIRVNNNWRRGYYSYRDNWRDDNFCYPYYTFNPWTANRSCSVSPWYYYPHLPGYIWASRITYYDNCSWNFSIGTSYNWHSRGGYSNYDNDRNRSELDDALYDIENAFERQDRRALERLIPERGRVNIYMDGTYCYSLNGDDFYDLMLDNIQDTDTVRYTITRVTTSRDEAQVSASHDYIDPWGRRQCVYHHYRLERDRYGYTITDFLTSGRP